MFVSKHPTWTATVIWRNGQTHHFDGAKDLFKFLADLPRYAPGRQTSEISLTTVTEYYGVTPVNARQAWYVMGSDITGPMGHELIPLATEAEAKEFMADHQGQRLLRFDEITPQVLHQLDH